MKISEVFHKKLRHSKGGVNVAGDIDVAVSANLDERRTSPISSNLAAPVDAAVAFKVTTDDSRADASTEQDVEADQSSEAET